MKCSIAEDLLPLYAEEICSEETKKDLEEHLKSCKKCSATLNAFKTNIKFSEEQADHDLVDQDLINQELNDPEKKDILESREKMLVVDSMKKVKKKLFSRKLTSILLALALIAVIGINGLLFWGERTGASLNYTTIGNIITLKRVSKALTNGDVEPLLAITDYDIKTIYCYSPQNILANPLEEQQRKKLKEALQYYFKGEKFKYEISDIQYLYSNNLSTGVTGEGTYSYMNPSGIITIKYYNDDTSINICFYQKADRKYSYEDNIFGIYENAPTFDSPSDDDFILYFMSRVTNKEKDFEKKPESALSLLIHYDKASMESLVKDTERPIIRERLSDLTEQGFKVTEFLYHMDRYDEEKNCMVYKCQFRIENSDGDFMLMEQDFYYEERNLYIIDGENAVEIYTSDNIPQKIKNQALNLFAPAR